ncbi:MAG TPA: efflux RND transporter periplasmic adaptor subunit [Rhodocyclaceae bacterium]|jgi:cobalt-zinc-cadmium efflux system membrane fusion protein|nr:efflux RND transporter periplasmic adaptor subunit [Rhodocyclaceae bacterium]
MSMSMAGWSRRAQLLTLGSVLILGAGGIELRHLLASHGVQQAAVPALPPGTFRPTDAQWAGLRMAPVQLEVFRPGQDTDGKIAIDDDTSTPVFSPFSGRVSEVFAKAGDTVKQGDPLFSVEASEFVQGQNDLISATAALSTARAQLKLAETAETRQRELYQAKGGALKDWQQAQLDLANGQGAVRTADISLAAARNRLRILGKSDQEIARLERSASGPMASASVVRAPIGGTIIQRQVGVGQYIASTASGSANPVFSIGNMSTVWLVANVREADAPSMQVGNPVEVRVLAYPGRVFTARLTYVAPSIDPNTRRLPVRAEVETPDGALKPEMFARFRILSGEEAKAPAVPESAVVREGDEARVWVADAHTKTLALRIIQAGLSRDGQVQVLDGLKEGETVVTAGALFIDRAAKND